MSFTLGLHKGIQSLKYKYILTCDDHHVDASLSCPSQTQFPSSPSPSIASNKLTASLHAARRGESPIPSTPSRRTPGILTPTARKQALRDFYNLDKSKTISSTTDLDREDFDGKHYVDKLVRERNLSTLIMMENDLVQGSTPGFC